VVATEAVAAGNVGTDAKAVAASGDGAVNAEAGEQEADDGEEDEEGGEDDDTEEGRAEAHALSPLPFGTGSGCGSGGHHCLVPCPLGEVDELLALAQLQCLGRNWAAVYDLAQQVPVAFAAPLFFVRASERLGGDVVALGGRTTWWSPRRALRLAMRINSDG
jgi:hypothetical protein